MKILHRHLTAKLVGAFLGALISLYTLYVLIDLVSRRLDNIIEANMPWTQVAIYYAAVMPEAVTRVHLTSLSLLIAVLAVFGAAARRNELTAAHAAGISLLRVATPAVLLAIAVALGQLALPEWITPRAEAEARRYEAEYLSDASPAYSGKREPVSWSNLAGGWTCHITKFNRSALSGEEVFLLKLEEDREEQIRARRIFWDASGNRWILEDGSRAVFTPQPGIAGNSAMVEHRITQEPAPLQESPDDLFQPFEDPNALRTSELPEIIRTARDRRVPVTGLQVELQARLAAAFLPVIVVLIGLPLGGRNRRGGRSATILLAVVLILFYLVLFNTMCNLGRLGHAQPVVAAWFANAVFVMTGFFLLRRIPT